MSDAHAPGHPRNRRAGTTPAILVEEARDPNHPLHGYFEWDDDKAALAYQRNQARRWLLEQRIEQGHRIPNPSDDEVL